MTFKHFFIWISQLALLLSSLAVYGGPKSTEKANLLFEGLSGFHNGVFDTWPPLIKFQVYRPTPNGNVMVDVKGPLGRSIGRIEGRLSNQTNQQLSPKIALSLFASDYQFSLASVLQQKIRGIGVTQDECYDATNFFHPKLLNYSQINLDIKGTYHGKPISFFLYVSNKKKLANGDQINYIKTDGWFGEVMCIKSSQVPGEMFINIPKKHAQPEVIRW